jgi:hypothetical protein
VADAHAEVAIVEITLVSNCTAGIKRKKLTAQTVEITHEPDVVLRGADGMESSGRLPSTTRWLGGTVMDLQGITDVRIVDSAGAVLIDGPLNSHFRVPGEVDGWVIFDVL